MDSPHLNLSLSEVTAHQRGRRAVGLPLSCRCSCCCSTALTWLLLPPSPTHFVARATLTLNSQVGRCRGRDAEAVARTAGVLPGILRLDPEDDEGAVDEDAHSELQVAAEEQKGRTNPVRHQHDADILLTLSLSLASFLLTLQA